MTALFAVSCSECVSAADIRSSPPKIIDVKATIEFRRLLQFPFADSPFHYSPAATRYLFLTAKGNVDDNGVWVEFVTGGTRSLASAKPKVAARLFTSALGNTPAIYNNAIQWLDEDQIAFLWEDRGGIKQVQLLDLRTGRIRQLSGHPTSVFQFALSRNGDRLLYTAPQSRDRALLDRMRHDGYVVRSTNGNAYIAGDIDGWTTESKLELYLGRLSDSRIDKLAIPELRGAEHANIMAFSPDGTRAIMVLPTPAPLPGWDRYTQAALRSIHLPQAKRNAEMSRLAQLYLIDADKATVRPVWDAPRTFNMKALWSADSRRIVLGPTFLPGDTSDRAGLEGLAIADIDVETGDYRRIPISREDNHNCRYVPKSWVGGIIELRPTRNSCRVMMVSSRAGGPEYRSGEGMRAKSQPPRVTLTTQESLNTPPVIMVAIGSAKRKLFDLNPGFRERFRLGHVQRFDWLDVERSWAGILYFPPDYHGQRRYPLVIQTYDVSLNRFSLLGDDHPSTFAAQALAARGIIVLQMGQPNGSSLGTLGATPAEPRAYTAAYEAAVWELDRRGIIDPARVGLSGFSRTGWRVQHALTHSQFIFAAAVTADNFDGSYVQAALAQWPEEYATDNGAPAFGEGLGFWLEEAPGFNADRIRTPLRLQSNSGHAATVIGAWEMFGRLRHLNYPVELYVIPQLEQGAHNLQNPRQILASASGTVDWFDYWLNGPGLTGGDSEQILRWDKLRTLRDAALREPRRPLLEWSAKHKEDRRDSKHAIP